MDNFLPHRNVIIPQQVNRTEFNNRSDVLTTGMRFYFDNRDRFSQKDQVKEWLVSEEGKQYLKDLIGKVIEKT